MMGALPRIGADAITPQSVAQIVQARAVAAGSYDRGRATASSAAR